MLKQSKCDQFGRGADVILGRSGNALCPVAAILNYMIARGTESGSFFLDSSGCIITKSWFVNQIRGVLNDIGLPQHQYAGHSFRIGAATTAALAGVEDSVIQTPLFMPMFVHILLSYFNVIGLFDTGPDTPTSPPTLQSWGVIGCKTTSSLGTFASQTPQKRGGLAKLTPPQGCSVVGSSRQSCDGGGSIDQRSRAR